MVIFLKFAQKVNSVKMAECRLVIIKRNGEDLNEQLLAPGTEWKIGKYVSTRVCL